MGPALLAGTAIPENEIRFPRFFQKSNHAVKLVAAVGVAKQDPFNIGLQANASRPASSSITLHRFDQNLRTGFTRPLRSTINAAIVDYVNPI
jgi:hypothetical protein